MEGMSPKTLLQAAAFFSPNDTLPAIIYVATGQEPVIVSRRLLRRAVNRYAAALHQVGIGQDDLVIVAHRQNLESIYLFWAAMYVGAVPAMFPTLTEKLNPDVYMGQLAQLVQQSGVQAILTRDDFVDSLQRQVACPVYGTTALATAVVY